MNSLFIVFVDHLWVVFMVGQKAHTASHSQVATRTTSTWENASLTQEKVAETCEAPRLILRSVYFKIRPCWHGRVVMVSRVPCNGEPAVLVHYVALIGNHSMVWITYCRWRYGLLVTQCLLSLLLSMVYQLVLSMTYQFQRRSGKNWLHESVGNNTNKLRIAISWIH